MADTFYSVSLGAKSAADVTVGAGTSGLAVELRVFDTAVGITGNKVELLKCIDAIEQYIIREIAPK